MKIYFDMDGVLVHFDAMRPNNKNLNHPSEELSPEMRAAKKQFWLDIEQQPNFWRDIPEMPRIEQLLKIAKQKGEIFVLSKTPSAKHFIGGQKYLDFLFKMAKNRIVSGYSRSVIYDKRRQTGNSKRTNKKFRRVSL